MSAPQPTTPLIEESKPKDLTKLSEETRESFRKILLLYNADTISNQKVSVEKLLAEYGRLNIWIEQTGASIRGRGSLEDTLRRDASLREDLIGVLEQLNKQLSTAINLGSKVRSEFLTTDQDNSSDFTSDSEYSTDSRQLDDAAKERQKIPRLSLTLLHAFESIGLLYHYSAILRRPRLAGRYLHSKAKDAAPNIPYYEYSHVQQKLKEWKLPETRPPDDSSPRDETHVEVQEETSNPQISQTLEDMVLNMRLAGANARRRDQLRYWNGHPFREDTKVEGTELPAGNAKAEVQSLAPASENRSFKSNPTVHTFSSVARSAIFEHEGGAGVSRTTYADSTVGGNRSVKRLPNVPRESRGTSSFECPFCHMSLDSASMQDRNTWKRHVFRDLRPYTCTFAKCNNPDKLYATRREWIYHEMQIHRRQWNCRLCSSHFRSDTEMVSHLKSAHAGNWDESQLHVLLEISEGPAEESQTQQCVFCLKSLSVKSLMEHVAGHLEELALFVLPNELEFDPAAEASSGILSSIDSVDDDKSILDPEYINPVDIMKPTHLSESLQALPDDASLDDFDGGKMLNSMAPASAQTNQIPTSPTFIPGSSIPGSPHPNAQYKCDLCDRVFDQIHKLNHHKRYHERGHVCPHPGCGKRFGTKTHLDRHINDKHLKQTRYHCTVSDCQFSVGSGKSFPRKDNWRRHMMNKHSLQVGEIPACAIINPLQNET